MSCEGNVKSFNAGKGYGFILYQDTDIFFHIRDCGEAQPVAGDKVSFEMEESSSKPGTYTAKNVTGGTGGSPAANNAAMKGMKGGGKSGVVGTGAFHGIVKSYNETKAWGFITHEGSDVFFHLKDMVDGSAPRAGDAVQFDLEENPGKPGEMKAKNLTGGTGWPTPPPNSKGGDKGKGGKGDYGAMWGGGGDAWGKGGYGPYGGGKDWGKGGGMDWGKGGGDWGKGGGDWGKGGGDWGKGGGDWGKGGGCDWGKGGGMDWGKGKGGGDWGKGGGDWAKGGGGGDWGKGGGGMDWSKGGGDAWGKGGGGGKDWGKGGGMDGGGGKDWGKGGGMDAGKGW